MQTAHTKKLVELTTAAAGPVAKIAVKASEAGILVPSILKKSLEDAGYKITYHKEPGENAPQGDHTHGAWVLVKDKDGHVVARAYSHDKPDALLQAVYAWLREEYAATHGPNNLTQFMEHKFHEKPKPAPVKGKK